MNSVIAHIAVLAAYLFLVGAALLLAWNFEARRSKGWRRLGFVVVMFLTAALVFRFSAPPKTFYDFFVGYYAAGIAANHHDLPALDSLTAGFVNLPIVAYGFAPFALLGPRVAAWCFTLLGLLLIVAAWWLLGSVVQAGERARWLIGLSFVANGPLISGIKFGNISYWILFAFVAALLLVARKRSVAAGVALGISAIVKPPVALFFIFFLVRRDYRGFCAFLATGVTVAALSVACVGWAANVHWFEKCVLQFRNYWLVGFMVQSVPAFIFRLTAPTSVLTDWNPELPTSSQHLFANLSIGVFLLIGLAALLRSEARRVPPGSEMFRVEQQFSLVLSLCLMASPLSWAHYYCWLLLPMVLCVRWPIESWLEVTIGLFAIVLTTLPIPWPVNLSDHAAMHVYSAFVESHVLFGGAVWFLLIAWKLARPINTFLLRGSDSSDENLSRLPRSVTDHLIARGL